MTTNAQAPKDIPLGWLVAIFVAVFLAIAIAATVQITQQRAAAHDQQVHDCRVAVEAAVLRGERYSFDACMEDQ